MLLVGWCRRSPYTRSGKADVLGRHSGHIERSDGPRYPSRGTRSIAHSWRRTDMAPPCRTCVGVQPYIGRTTRDRRFCMSAGSCRTEVVPCILHTEWTAQPQVGCHSVGRWWRTRGMWMCCGTRHKFPRCMRSTPWAPGARAPAEGTRCTCTPGTSTETEPARRPPCYRIRTSHFVSLGVGSRIEV